MDFVFFSDTPKYVFVAYIKLEEMADPIVKVVGNETEITPLDINVQLPRKSYVPSIEHIEDYEEQSATELETLSKRTGIPEEVVLNMEKSVKMDVTITKLKKLYNSISLTEKEMTIAIMYQRAKDESLTKDEADKLRTKAEEAWLKFNEPSTDTERQLFIAQRTQVTPIIENAYATMIKSVDAKKLDVMHKSRKKKSEEEEDEEEEVEMEGEMEGEMDETTQKNESLVSEKAKAATWFRSSDNLWALYNTYHNPGPDAVKVEESVYDNKKMLCSLFLGDYYSRSRSILGTEFPHGIGLWDIGRLDNNTKLIDKANAHWVTRVLNYLKQAIVHCAFGNSALKMIADVANELRKKYYGSWARILPLLIHKTGWIGPKTKHLGGSIFLELLQNKIKKTSIMYMNQLTQKYISSGLAELMKIGAFPLNEGALVVTLCCMTVDIPLPFFIEFRKKLQGAVKIPVKEKNALKGALDIVLYTSGKSFYIGTSKVEALPEHANFMCIENSIFSRGYFIEHFQSIVDRFAEVLEGRYRDFTKWVLEKNRIGLGAPFVSLYKKEQQQVNKWIGQIKSAKDEESLYELIKVILNPNVKTRVLTTEAMDLMEESIEEEVETMEKVEEEEEEGEGEGEGEEEESESEESESEEEESESEEEEEEEEGEFVRETTSFTMDKETIPARMESIKAMALKYEDDEKKRKKESEKMIFERTRGAAKEMSDTSDRSNKEAFIHYVSSVFKDVPWKLEKKDDMPMSLSRARYVTPGILFMETENDMILSMPDLFYPDEMCKYISVIKKLSAMKENETQLFYDTYFETIKDLKLFLTRVDSRACVRQIILDNRSVRMPRLEIIWWEQRFKSVDEFKDNLKRQLENICGKNKRWNAFCSGNEFNKSLCDFVLDFIVRIQLQQKQDNYGHLSYRVAYMKKRLRMLDDDIVHRQNVIDGMKSKIEELSESTEPDDTKAIEDYKSKIRKANATLDNVKYKYIQLEAKIHDRETQLNTETPSFPDMETGITKYYKDDITKLLLFANKWMPKVDRFVSESDSDSRYDFIATEFNTCLKEAMETILKDMKDRLIETIPSHVWYCYGIVKILKYAMKHFKKLGERIFRVVVMCIRHFADKKTMTNPKPLVKTLLERQDVNDVWTRARQKTKGSSMFAREVQYEMEYWMHHVERSLDNDLYFSMLYERCEYFLNKCAAMVFTRNPSEMEKLKKSYGEFKVLQFAFSAKPYISPLVIPSKLKENSVSNLQVHCKHAIFGKPSIESSISEKQHDIAVLSSIVSKDNIRYNEMIRVHYKPYFETVFSVFRYRRTVTKKMDKVRKSFRNIKDFASKTDTTLKGILYESLASVFPKFTNIIVAHILHKVEKSTRQLLILSTDSGNVLNLGFEWGLFMLHIRAHYFKLSGLTIGGKTNWTIDDFVKAFDHDGEPTTDYTSMYCRQYNLESKTAKRLNGSLEILRTYFRLNRLHSDMVNKLKKDDILSNHLSKFSTVLDKLTHVKEFNAYLIDECHLPANDSYPVNDFIMRIEGREEYITSLKDLPSAIKQFMERPNFVEIYAVNLMFGQSQINSSAISSLRKDSPSYIESILVSHNYNILVVMAAGAEIMYGPLSKIVADPSEPVSQESDLLRRIHSYGRYASTEVLDDDTVERLGLK